MRAVAEIGVLTASAAFGGVQTFAGKAAVSTISAPRGVRSDRTRSRALRLRPAAEAADSLKQAGVHAEIRADILDHMDETSPRLILLQENRGRCLRRCWAAYSIVPVIQFGTILFSLFEAAPLFRNPEPTIWR
jgi:hypothetical protein